MPPSQRDKIKRSLTIWVDCDLWVKLDKLSEATGLDKTTLITAYLEEATKDIKLDENDYKDIARWINR